MDKKTPGLIKGYLDKAKEKLASAANLLEDGAYDDTVSRAYYAAFHAASAVLLTEGLEVDSHRGLLNLFGLHFIKTGKLDKKFGRFLHNLKDDRETGDYEVFSSVDKAVAEKALKEATEFVSGMTEYLAPFFKD